MKKYFITILLIAIVIFNSCEEKEKHPVLATTEVIANSSSSVIAKAIVAERGNSPITDHGFVYYISTYEPNNIPLINDNNKISLGKNIKDTFSAQINLSYSYYGSNDYKCYVRAYIINEIGTVYSNQMNVALPVLSLNSVSPQVGKVGDTISILGNNFNLNPSYNGVKFNYTTAQVVEATKTQLKVIVPSGIEEDYYGYIDISVTSAGNTLYLDNIFSLSPSPSSFAPATGTWYTDIYIYGSGFNQATIYFGNYQATNYYRSTGYISCEVPYGIPLKSFKIYIEKSGVKTEVPGGNFTMNPLTVSSFNPTSIIAGNELTVYGQNFHPYNSNNTLFIGSTKVTSNYRSSSYLEFTIPGTLQPGEYPLSLSNGIDTTVISGSLKVIVPVITGLSPTSGYAGSDLYINGNNLGTSLSYYTYIYFDNNSYYLYINDSSNVKIKVPTISPGTYKISMDINSKRVYSPVDFTVLAPTLSSISPTSGIVGTAVILSGTGFGTNTSNVVVKFGNINATILSVTDNQINAKVPTGVSNGAWSVTVNVNGYTIANSLTFTIP